MSLKRFFLALLLILPLLLSTLPASAAKTPEKPESQPEQEQEQEQQETKAGLRIELTNQARLDGTLYRLTLSSKSEKIKFKWNKVKGATKYRVTIALTADKDDPVYKKKQTARSISLTARDYEADRNYVITVEALSGSTVLDKANIRFNFSVRSKRRVTKKVQVPTDPSRQGVIAGRAITDQHAYGSRDDSLYGSVSLSSTEEAVTRLVCDDTELGIHLDDGNAAFLSVLEPTDDDALAMRLTPAETGVCWTVSMDTLETLNRSGVSDVFLTLSAQDTELPTDLTLTGRVYAGLKAQGIPDSQFILKVDDSGIYAEVQDETYRVNDNMELEIELP